MITSCFISIYFPLLKADIFTVEIWRDAIPTIKSASYQDQVYGKSAPNLTFIIDLFARH